MRRRAAAGTAQSPHHIQGRIDDPAAEEFPAGGE